MAVDVGFEWFVGLALPYGDWSGPVLLAMAAFAYGVARVWQDQARELPIAVGGLPASETVTDGEVESWRYAGTGRLGWYRPQAPLRVLAAAVRAAREVVPADARMSLQGAWPDEEEWDRLLRSAGWELRRAPGVEGLRPPELVGMATAEDMTRVERLLMASNDLAMAGEPREVSVTLRSPRPVVTLTYDGHRRTLAVAVAGDDAPRTLATLREALLDAAPSQGIRLSQATDGASGAGRPPGITARD